jgi:hypothetical protein
MPRCIMFVVFGLKSQIEQHTDRSAIWTDLYRFRIGCVVAAGRMAHEVQSLLRHDISRLSRAPVAFDGSSRPKVYTRV